MESETLTVIFDKENEETTKESLWNYFKNMDRSSIEDFESKFEITFACGEENGESIFLDKLYDWKLFEKYDGLVCMSVPPRDDLDGKKFRKKLTFEIRWGKNVEYRINGELRSRETNLYL